MPSRTIALVPFRTSGGGKSRLTSALGPADRAALAVAMLTDVVTTLHAAGLEVVIAAKGSAASAAADDLGVEALQDPPGVLSLDAALHAATARLSRVAGPVLVVAADLPRLAVEEVRTVLEAEAEVVVAPTHDGGTGGLLRRPWGVIPTAYGEGSADRHLALARGAGVREVCLDLPGFRHDLDTGADLLALGKARRIGGETTPGASTAALLPGLLTRAGTILPARDDVPEEASMPQGTVKTYDPVTRTGTLVDDALRERRFDRDAFTASGLQELRIGQRVRYQLEGGDEDARVAQLNIVSL